MNLNDLKIYGLNFSSLAISMTNIDLILKLTLLVVTIAFHHLQGQPKMDLD